MNFEIFTDRARKVLSLAKTEASECDVCSVYTEHLLIALIREGSGVAHHILCNFDMSIKRIRDEGCARPGRIRDEGALLHSRIQEVPYSEGLKKVFGYAEEEAKTLLSHNYVGTEHLLLGLIHEEHNNAIEILKKCGADPKEVRQATLELLGYGSIKYHLKSHTTSNFHDIHASGEPIGIYDKATDTINIPGYVALSELQFIVRAIREHKYEKK